MPTAVDGGEGGVIGKALLWMLGSGAGAVNRCCGGSEGILHSGSAPDSVRIYPFRLPGLIRCKREALQVRHDALRTLKTNRTVAAPFASIARQAPPMGAGVQK